MVSNLREMNERMQSWMNEKPSFDGGNEYRPRKDDLVIFQFVANGDEGDKFIKTYRSHILESFSKTNQRINIPRYCAVSSAEEGDISCQYCEIGHNDIKERMSIWMYVHNILHTTLPNQERPLPQITYENRVYFNEEINGFKIWHTSAWRESCWSDIVKLSEIYKGLHNFTGQLVVTGEGMQRRFKLYAIPNSPSLDPTVYERANTECEPILQLLKNALASPVATSPREASASQTVAQGAQEIRPFSPLGSNSIPTLNVRATTPTVLPTPSTATPVPPPTEEIKTVPEEDTRRPLKSLF